MEILDCVTSKVCKWCNLEKPLDDFIFHSTKQKYLAPCRECYNRKKREKHKEKRGDDFDYTRSKIRQKKCSICKVLKPINLDNFPSSGKGFRAYCYECKPKRRAINGIPVKGIRDEVKLIKYVFSVNKSVDRRKGREFSLTLQDVKEFLSKPCVYCGYPSTGLDRIDNSIGHTKENCVTCCKECNIARMDNFTHEEMKIIGEVIKKVKNQRINSNIKIK